jgi:hypothetical protein
MKWARVVIAILVAAGSSVALRTIGGGAAESSAQRRPLVDRDAVSAENLAEIVLERDGARVRFVRRGDSWWQVEPIEHAVDSWSMRQFASRLLACEVVREIDLARDESGAARDAESREALARDAGLSPAVARIELVEQAPAEGVAPRRVQVELGRRSLAGRAYARVGGGDGSRIAVVDAALHEFALERDLREFRRREVFVDLAEVDSVEFSSGSNRIELVRDGRVYRLASPVRTRADRAAAEEFVDALRRAKSGGFVTDSPAEPAVYGLAPAAAALSVRAGSQTRRLLVGDTVSIGAQDRFGMLEGSPTVFRLPAATLATILPRAERLVDGVASGVRAADIGGIEIARSGTDERLSLRREVKGWTGRSTRQGAAESTVVPVAVDAVDRLVAALTSTRAGAVEIAQLPAERVAATITLLGFADEPIDTVRIAQLEPRAGDAAPRTALDNGDGVLRVHGSIDLPITAAELRGEGAQPGQAPRQR